MSYSDNQTFTLTHVGAPELWVTYSRPGLLPYKEGQKFIKKYKNFKTKKINEDNSKTMEVFLEDTEAEFQWVLELIEDWNLIYTSKHEQSGELLPIPSIQQDIWIEIPGLYLSYIVSVIKQDPTGADFLAKGMLTSISTLTPLLTEEVQTEINSNG